MANPWMKKNPLLSMWLSGANAVAGSARSQATAQVKRQTAAMMAEGTKQVLGYWSGVMAPPSRKRKKAP
jgi:hypothetical protein